MQLRTAKKKLRQGKVETRKSEQKSAEKNQELLKAKETQRKQDKKTSTTGLIFE